MQAAETVVYWASSAALTTADWQVMAVGREERGREGQRVGRRRG
jgi:hypothetical protein